MRNPAKSLRPLLAVVDEVCAETAKAFSDSGPAVAGYPAFDRTILNRGLNLLEAIRVLAVPLHWEAAASIARQMFELILNMEALASMPNREEGAYRFALFGLLQKTRSRHTEIEYERETGRPVDEAHAAQLAALLAGPHFDTFRGRTNKAGKTIWQKSWTGKTPYDLAEASPSANRKSQYAQLFVAWSEEAHATPAALVDAMFRTNGAAWADELLADDLKEMTQILVMVVHHYFELWTLLTNVPPIDGEAWAGWFARIRAYMADEWNVAIPPPDE